MATDIATALARPGCERLRDWASIGPVQMAALELFIDELGTPHCTKKLNNLHANYIALQAECEALRKDAERLNWLEQGGQWELTRLRASAKPDAMRYWMVEDFDGDDLTQETDEAERQTLRGAIDAAMGKEEA
jgi:hypothetical protein